MSWEYDFLVMLQGMRGPLLDVIMKFLSTLGDPKFRKIGLEMAVSMAITYVIGNLILKKVVDRSRPCDNMDYKAIIDSLIVARPHDASFPSGHSMNGFSASVALLCNDKRLGIVAVILATLIAFSRLYNFMHFPTDVLVGIALGTIIALLVHRVFQKSIWNRKKQDV